MKAFLRHFALPFYSHAYRIFTRIYTITTVYTVCHYDIVNATLYLAPMRSGLPVCIYVCNVPRAYTLCLAYLFRCPLLVCTIGAFRTPSDCLNDENCARQRKLRCGKRKLLLGAEKSPRSAVVLHSRARGKKAGLPESALTPLPCQTRRACHGSDPERAAGRCCFISLYR